MAVTGKVQQLTLLPPGEKAARFSGPPLPPQGVFAVLSGAPAPNETFVADTFKLEKRGGELRRVTYVQVRCQASGATQLVSSTDSACHRYHRAARDVELRAARPALAPQPPHSAPGASVPAA